HVLGLRKRRRNFDGLLGILLRFGQHLHVFERTRAPMQAPGQRLRQQRERGDVVRHQRDFLFPILLHLLRVPGLQVSIGQRPVNGRSVPAFGILQEKCFANFNLFGGIIRNHGLKRFVRGVFFGIHRRRHIQRQRRNLRSLRLVARLRRRLALGSLCRLRTLRTGDSTHTCQQSRDGYRFQPDIPLLSHPFSPPTFLLRSRFVQSATSAAQQNLSEIASLPSRPRNLSVPSKRREPFLCRLSRLFRPAFHT